MLRDFGSNTLPVDASHTYDTSQDHRLKSSNWPRINQAAVELVLGCLRKPVPEGGWMKVDNAIAVLILPSSSLMRFYWANDLTTDVDGKYNLTASVRERNLIRLDGNG